jgi:hypothetical protein
MDLPLKDKMLKRMESKITKTDYCWIWNRHVKTNGYAQILFNGREIMAHRVMYMLLIGEIPQDMQIDHLCRNKRCMNPNHMDVVTQQENMRRMFALRTHCRRGHEYNKLNTYIRMKKQKNGKTYPDRICRLCVSLRRQNKRKARCD